MCDNCPPLQPDILKMSAAVHSKSLLVVSEKTFLSYFSKQTESEKGIHPFKVVTEWQWVFKFWQKRDFKYLFAIMQKRVKTGVGDKLFLLLPINGNISLLIFWGIPWFRDSVNGQQNRWASQTPLSITLPHQTLSIRGLWAGMLAHPWWLRNMKVSSQGC